VRFLEKEKLKIRKEKSKKLLSNRKSYEKKNTFEAKRRSLNFLLFKFSAPSGDPKNDEKNSGNILEICARIAMQIRSN
jgi:hypothetical protein